LHGYKIRKGDLITAGTAHAVVIKTTQAYIYYILNSHKAKVKKKTLWNAYDTRKDVEIHYGNTKHRRLQRKMRTLSLLGVKYEKVDDEIRKFLNFVQLPCMIITGNSGPMKGFARGVAAEYKWACREELPGTPGTMIITEE